MVMTEMMKKRWEAVERQFRDAFVIYPEGDVQVLRLLWEKSGCPEDLRKMQCFLSTPELRDAVHLGPLSPAEAALVESLGLKAIGPPREESEPLAREDSAASAATDWDADEYEASVRRRQVEEAEARRRAAAKVPPAAEAAKPTTKEKLRKKAEEQRERRAARRAEQTRRVETRAPEAAGEEASRRKAEDDEWVAMFSDEVAPRMQARDCRAYYEVELQRSTSLEVFVDGDSLVVKGVIYPESQLERRELLEALTAELRQYPPRVRSQSQFQRTLLRKIGQARGYGTVDQRYNCPADANLSKATLERDGKTTYIRIPKVPRTKPRSSYYYGGRPLAREPSYPPIATGPGFWW
jgi:hypothetical protein